MRRYDYEEVVSSKTFCVFKEDTLELFGGNFTPNKFTIEPKKEYHVDLNPSPDDLLDLFEKYKDNYKTEQPFLRDVAEHSINCFSWDNAMIIDRDINRRRIRFRDAHDSTTQEWK
jgi:hypothetical protein